MASQSTFLSIDVECVATGYGHDARSPCSVAIINDQCEILFQSLIKPSERVVSDLYPLSGLRLKDLEQAPSLDEVLQQIHPMFNARTVIIGQRPENDLKWLKLQAGIHYAEVIDIAEWFATKNPRDGRIRYFSLAHEAWVLLNIDLNAQQGHLPTEDAKAAMRLYLTYKNNESSKAQAGQLLFNTPVRMTPAKACNYNYEGVCLAAFFPKMCSCDRKTIPDPSLFDSVLPSTNLESVKE